MFEGGALRNNLRYAKSENRQALINYEQTIQHALGDVSDALIGYDKYHVVRERQEQSVKDLQESVNVSLMRYRGGTSNYLDVLDSQRSLSTPTSLWRRLAITSTRAWCNSIRRSAAAGSNPNGERESQCLFIDLVRNCL
jgi:Outer membrane efflux protein